MKKNSSNKKRFIDNEKIKEKLAELHTKQLDTLLERLEQGLIEAQEMRLIWDMVKTHGIGIESVEEMVEKALKTAEINLEDIEVDDPEWSFTD